MTNGFSGEKVKLTGQAGICILEEAGGRCFGGKNTPLSGDHDRELIGEPYFHCLKIRRFGECQG